MTVSTRSLVKLEATATAFRLAVTAAAGLLGLAILAEVTAANAIASAVLVLTVAAAGPIVHGWLAVILRDEREYALEATLIATAVLWALDGATAVTLHLQDVLVDDRWTYLVGIAAASLLHLAVLVQAGRAYADRQAREVTEPEPEGA